MTFRNNPFRSALLCVKPGGSVVYSTCSLSPVQNDGVVYNALKSIWEDTKIEFSVRYSSFVELAKFLYLTFQSP